MTESLSLDGGTIAYEVTGEGPLVVLAPGLGNSRDAYRFVAPRLVAAGYRVATSDLLPAGPSRLEMIDGAGPHAQYPDQATSLVLSFLQANARA